MLYYTLFYLWNEKKTHYNIKINIIHEENIMFCGFGFRNHEVQCHDVSGLL